MADAQSGLSQALCMSGCAGVGGAEVSLSSDGMDDREQATKPTAPVPRNHVGKYLPHRQPGQVATVAADPHLTWLPQMRCSAAAVATVATLARARLRRRQTETFCLGWAAWSSRAGRKGNYSEHKAASDCISFTLHIYYYLLNRNPTHTLPSLCV